MRKITIAFAATCLAAAVATVPTLAQYDAKPAAAPAKEAAKDQRDRKVLVDNDKVLVTEGTYKPGSSSGQLPRGERVVRALTDGQLEKTWPDGRKETVNWKAGQVRYSPKETYSQKNTGTTDVTLYTVTIK